MNKYDFIGYLSILTWNGCGFLFYENNIFFVFVILNSLIMLIYYNAYKLINESLFDFIEDYKEYLVKKREK